MFVSFLLPVCITDPAGRSKVMTVRAEVAEWHKCCCGSMWYLNHVIWFR